VLGEMLTVSLGIDDVLSGVLSAYSTDLFDVI
jgi:hypothetical protein